MHPIGGRVPTARWTAYGSDDFVEWLTSCHPDNRVFTRVYGHFIQCVDRIEIAGPRAGTKWVEKLHWERYRGLGKVNYNDQVGAFRFFFKFGTLAGRPVVVFGDGDYKTSPDFRPERYERAVRAVEKALTDNGVIEAHLW